jgi:hypothetical protein
MQPGEQIGPSRRGRFVQAETMTAAADDRRLQPSDQFG